MQVVFLSSFVRCLQILVVAAGCSVFISCLFSNHYIFVFFLVQSAKMTKKKLRFGALPTVNMPRRSHDSKPPEQRPAQAVVRDVEPESRSSCYKSFIEFCERTKSLKSIGDWCVKLSDDRKLFKKMVEPYLLPEWRLLWTIALVSQLKCLARIWLMTIAYTSDIAAQCDSVKFSKRFGKLDAVHWS